MRMTDLTHLHSSQLATRITKLAQRQSQLRGITQWLQQRERGDTRLTLSCLFGAVAAGLGGYEVTIPFFLLGSGVGACLYIDDRVNRWHFSRLEKSATQQGDDVRQRLHEYQSHLKQLS